MLTWCGLKEDGDELSVARIYHILKQIVASLISNMLEKSSNYMRNAVPSNQIGFRKSTSVI